MARGLELSLSWGPEMQTLQSRLRRMSRSGMKVAMRRATHKSVLYAQTRTIDLITGGSDYAKLSPLTRLFRAADRYSNIPLFRTGALTRAINTRVTNYNKGSWGVLATRRTKRRNSKTPATFANIALILHDGGTIQVTPAMRRYLAMRIAIARKKVGGGATKSFGPGSPVIRIPPRPFIKNVAEDQNVVRRIQGFYFQELRTMLDEVARR